MLHDGIGYLAQSYILNACNEVCLEVHKKELEPWVKSSPTWESIVELCASVFKTKVAGPEFDNLCSPYAHSNTHDKIHENQLLANHDLLCYMALSDDMNHGDIGLVTNLLWMWVPMFRGCGWQAQVCHLSWDTLQVDPVHSDSHYRLPIPPLFCFDPVHLLSRESFFLSL